MPRLRLVPPAVALVLVGALGLGACASSDDIDQQQFTADLRERTDITEAQATCLTDKIYDEFDQAEVNRIYHAATEAEVGGDTLETLDGFNAECITDAGSSSSDSSDEGSSDEGDDATTTTEG